MSSTSTGTRNTATLTWEIDNFVNLSSSSITSNTFNFEKDNKHEFKLYLYPKCHHSYFGESTSIVLSCQTDGIYNFSLWIVNANKDKCIKQETRVYFLNGSIIYGLINFWNTFLRDPTKELLSNGKLTIYCEVSKIEENESSISGIGSSQVNLRKIAEDLKSLLENENFSDTLLVVGKKEFRVHKAILAARSTVFKAMFEHDCKEKKQNRVEIIDLDVEVCEEFLRYLYTGNVTSLDKLAPELMAAADKYQLDELKSICEQILCKSLDINSVASVLQLADMHNAQQLKSNCIEYITANAKDVQDTEGWKKLFIAKPELGFQLFLNVANRK